MQSKIDEQTGTEKLIYLPRILYHSITTKITFIMVTRIFSFSSHRQLKCRLLLWLLFFSLSPNLCLWGGHLPYHTNWSGVKRDLNVKKCSSISPQGIVIIKYSNISVERHVYINKWVLKKYIKYKNNTTYIFGRYLYLYKRVQFYVKWCETKHLVVCM